MWIEPKTNWQRIDSFSLDPDYNRIRGNILHLHDVAQRLYPSFNISAMGVYTTDGLPYVEFFNSVEMGLERLYSSTFKRPNYTSRTLAENGAVWDWRDLNRIESTLRQIYSDLLTVEQSRYTLSFVMGGGAFASAI